MQIERLKYEDVIVYLLTHNDEIICTKCTQIVPNKAIEDFITHDFAEQVRRCKVIDAGDRTKRKFYDAQLKAKSKEIEKILDVLE